MKLHLLLIDNDNEELDFLNEAIKETEFDCRCSYAPGAETAFEVLPHLDLDFIFIDINMPLINGYECLARIKKDNIHKKARLVMYSTGLDITSETKALAMGADSCLRKTNTIPELSLAISKLIIEAKGTAEM